MFPGTNMLILPLSHPVTVTEEFAPLDHLSRRHAIAGFGLRYRRTSFDSFCIPSANGLAARGEPSSSNGDCGQEVR